MRVLVTGGAGYIGSCVALALADNGDAPVLLDDLSSGDPEFVRRFPHFVGDVGDPDLIARIMDEYPDIRVTVHCAARTEVAESIEDPLGYYAHNVGKTVRLLDALLANGCHRFLFSSSAAVYGPSAARLISEDAELQPASPYARTKVIVEQLLSDACRATPLTAVSLRYFNPIGCDPQLRGGPANPPASGVVESLLAAAAADRPFRIHGRDWDTPDGTPLRDFVHVWDVASAHVAAVHRWPADSRGARHEIVNVGSGVGTTVRQLAETFNGLAPRPVAVEYDERRPGDIVGGFAATERAAALFGWRPTQSVAQGVTDALRWAELRARACAPR
jgi:UDP-glucose 4-epimerase